MLWVLIKSALGARNEYPQHTFSCRYRKSIWMLPPPPHPRIILIYFYVRQILCFSQQKEVFISISSLAVITILNEWIASWENLPSSMNFYTHWRRISLQGYLTMQSDQTFAAHSLDSYISMISASWKWELIRLCRCAGWCVYTWHTSLKMQSVDIIIQLFVMLPLKSMYFHIFDKNSYAEVIKATIMKKTHTKRTQIDKGNKHDFKRSVNSWLVMHHFLNGFFKNPPFKIAMSGQMDGCRAGIRPWVGIGRHPRFTFCFG